MRPSQTNGGGGGSFRTTQWTAVLLASDLEAPGAEEALAGLCNDYWYPLYAYVRRRGHAPHDAEDLTQDFFRRLLTKSLLQGITREGGKFRSFLLTSLNHFLCNEWEKARSQKRGGGKAILSLDEEAEDRYQLEPVDHITPERLFEKQWAFAVLDRAARLLSDEYTHKGKPLLFQELYPLLGSGSDLPSHAEIARQLKMTESSVKTAAHRLRKRYAELLREEIGRTVTEPAEIAEELRHLVAVSAAFHYSFTHSPG